MNNKISVIMPIFNTAAYLQQAIESVWNQTYQNWECFLVDDGSTDGCGEICDRYGQKDCRFRVLHTENLGVSHARNIALEQASGEWVCFIDSDDYFERDAFEKLLGNTNDTTVDVVMGAYRTADSALIGSHNIRRYNVPNISDAQLDELFALKFFNCVWGKLYRRRSILLSFPESMTLGEDTTFNLEAFWGWKQIVIIPGHILNRHVRNDSLSKKFYFDFPDKLWKIFEEWSITFKDHPIMLENASWWYVSSLRGYYRLFIHCVQISVKDKLTLMDIWLADDSFTERPVYTDRLDEDNSLFWHMLCKRDSRGILNALQ